MGCFVAMLNANGAPVEKPLVHAMLDVPPYRSPTDRCVWTQGSVGLGFSALHIEPRIAETAQPASLGGRLWAVMDGRLDDRQTLVRHLESHVGRALASASDVELVLEAYDAWGAGFTDRVIGDFALCLWDVARRVLLCARDHLGVKPLYYAYVGGNLVVSNVLRSLRRHPGVSGRFNDRAIGDFLLFGLCMEPTETSFADVARVPPAHTLSSSPGAVPAVERYWAFRPSGQVRHRDPREYVQHFSSALDTAVSDRLRGGPVGILMSGGLDSSSLAATAVGVLGPSAASTGLRAFTAVYDTVAEDEERRYSSLVAQALDISIEHVPIDAYRLFDRWSGDALPPEPSSEPMTAMMADLLEGVSRHGSVVLTGDGGDPSLLPSTVVSQLGRVPLGTLTADLWRLATSTRTLPPFGVRSAVRGWWPRPESGVPAWLADSLLRGFDARARWREVSARRAAANGARGAAFSSVVDPWWVSVFEGHDPGATQRSVELRYPFFDVRLLSLTLALPSYPWCVNKEILRQAMCGRLPEQIRLRPKTPLATGAPATHGRWTLREAADTIEAVPAMAQYVDIKKFRSTARLDDLITESGPGTLEAVALAVWLRGSASASVAA